MSRSDAKTVHARLIAEEAEEAARSDAAFAHARKEIESALPKRRHDFLRFLRRVEG